MRVLKSFQQPVESWDTLLIYLITSKLDTITKREWESVNITSEVPTMEKFIQFLTNRCQLLETLHTNKEIKQNTEPNMVRYRSNKSSSFVTSNKYENKTKCFYCKDEHFIYYCKKFLELPIRTRISEVRKLKLCLNCLKLGHGVESCRSSGCRTCNKKHNSLLHINDYTGSQQTSTTPSDTRAQSQVTQQNAQPHPHNTTIQTHSTTAHSHYLREYPAEILLSTALVIVYDKSGKPHQARVLLDSGSQSNFVTRELCDKLQLNKQKVQIPVSGLSQNITHIDFMTSAKLQSKCNSFQLNTTFLILEKITEVLPMNEIDINNFSIPNNIVLADQTFNKPSKIDILLGASVFYDLMCIGQIKTGNDQPVLQKTKFGWVISGNTLPPCSNKIRTVCHFSNINIQDQMEKFWKIEDVIEEKRFSKEEEDCENEFQNSYERRQDGHFVVPILAKENIHQLGNSYDTALRRFSTLESKLSQNSDFRESYTNFMKEYEELGHMTKVEQQDITNDIHYYLPHHGIIKETSTTSKCRVVFDGSCKTDNGISLNNKLKIGPTIQQDLLSILIRFRKHNIVLTGDIEKMYRQVYIKVNQRDLQRIIWRADPNSEIAHYRLNTVTYGTASAPYLAIRALFQAGMDHETTYPSTSNVIKTDFYVDDLLTGSPNIESTIILKNQLQEILSKYGFTLRKWASNRKEVLMDTSIEQTRKIEHFISEDQLNKTLGLYWNSERDSLHFSFNPINTHKVTKRIILSTISQIFDPLGLVGPCIVKAKIILQKLWKLNLSWDESVPSELHTIWVDFIKQVKSINSFNIPRQVTIIDSLYVQIHGFSDSSEMAYGACVYIRSTSKINNHIVKLLCSKSRVAPVKSISLPKLELCAADLLTKLMQKAISSLDMKLSDSQVFYWTDSTIVLSWINGEPYKWKTFVANRVSNIQSLSKLNQWNHVCTKMNPADIISRGSNPEELIASKLWWNGPSWLSKKQEDWPESKKYLQSKEIPERRPRKTVISMNTCNNSFELCNKFSSLSRLQKIVAYIFRFQHNTLNIHNKLTGLLKVYELNHSLNCLIRIAQEESFPEEMAFLSKQKSIKQSSKIIALHPFLDDNHILRVGGRLKNAFNPSYSQKHPIILPSKHRLTTLIIRDAHYRSLHSGPQALLSLIRTKYWPISGKNTVKSVLKNCIVCFRVKPIPIKHLMGNLPSERITPARPFLHCGVDYAGPFTARAGNMRKSKVSKVYLCIFICLVTKAIHLELVYDLSSESFLNSLKRFIGRRGKPLKILSDNATNFVGANHELQRFVATLSHHDFQENVQNSLALDSIQWEFIPASSPHFGGLWEAAVKSAKFHLKRVVGNLTLTYEGLNTIIIQIEACLNSRPLTPISTDPSDFQALTPSHFLIGSPLISFHEPDLSDIPTNRLNHYQQYTQIIQNFWARWSVEYINILQCRTKWKCNHQQLLQPGSLVLIKDDKQPPLKWKMGRVIKVFPGRDNIIRVASIKTSSGELTRAVTKLCVLPSEEM